jgi:hypothetical protein
LNEDTRKWTLPAARLGAQHPNGGPPGWKASCVTWTPPDPMPSNSPTLASVGTRAKTAYWHLAAGLDHPGRLSPADAAVTVLGLTRLVRPRRITRAAEAHTIEHLDLVSVCHGFVAAFGRLAPQLCRQELTDGQREIVRLRNG